MKLQLFMSSVALLAAGCASETQPAPEVVTQPQVVVEPPPPPPPPAQVATLANAYEKARIQHVAFKQVALDELAETMAVSDVRRSKTNDGYDRVQVFVKNFSGDRMRIRYRFNWVNNDGVEIRDPDHDAWEKLTVDAGDDATLTSIAPNKDCYDFKLRMKRTEK
jgi:uncharacterized protein YcfL